MKTKKYWIWVIVSFSILVVVWTAGQITGKTGLSAKDKENGSLLSDFHKSVLSAEWVVADKKEILQGLEEVSVLVEPIKPEIEEYGLKTQALQTDTELQLRQYGIKVLTWGEMPSTSGLPILDIEVVVLICGKVPLAAAGITVRLTEAALLLREPKRLCLGAATWQRSYVFQVGLDKIKDLRGNVKDLVNEFINDYLAANPKDGSIKEKGSLLDDYKLKK